MFVVSSLLEYTSITSSRNRNIGRVYEKVVVNPKNPCWNEHRSARDFRCVNRRLNCCPVGRSVGVVHIIVNSPVVGVNNVIDSPTLVSNWTVDVDACSQRSEGRRSPRDYVVGVEVDLAGQV